MTIMLINATQRDELRSATIDDNGKLLNYDMDTPQLEQKKSNIYKAVVTSIEPSLGALFVNFGSERTGFLPFSNISPEYYTQPVNQGESADIRRLFKLGQEVVVQVEKDERGSKGAALTTYISLAGSYCVLMPNNSRGGGISRQIEGKEREDLQQKLEQVNCPEGMGLIVRTAGVNRSAEELGWDLSILLKYWDAIRQAAVAKPGPYLIHQEGNVVMRSVRDNLREDIREVIIDNKAAFQEVHDYIQLVRPNFLDRIKLHNSPTPLFSHYQIEAQIEKAYQHEVQLPSGGSIVIDHTEALISIDVNSARATKGKNIEETAYHTNMEAAEEVAHQLRIRDLGGLLVIDFIDMTPPNNRRDVENCLRNAVKMDRARIQIERISRFGLLEMSRQRLRRTLSRAIKAKCPRCQGQGTIQSVESLANVLIHRLEEQLTKASSPLQFTVQAPFDLATYLINERRESIASLESDGATQIIIIPNQHMQTPDYAIKTSDVNTDALNKMPSYQIIKQGKPGTPPANKSQKQASRTFDEPIMNQYLSVPDATQGPSNGGTGVFKRLITRMFGDEKETEQAATPARKSRPASNSTDKKPAAASNSGRGGSTSRDERGSSQRPARQQSSASKPDQARTRRGSRGGTARSNEEPAQQADRQEPPRRRRQPNRDQNIEAEQTPLAPKQSDDKPNNSNRRPAKAQSGSKPAVTKEQAEQNSALATAAKARRSRAAETPKPAPAVEPKPAAAPKPTVEPKPAADNNTPKEVAKDTPPKRRTLGSAKQQRSGSKGGTRPSGSRNSSANNSAKRIKPRTAPAVATEKPAAQADQSNDSATPDS